jgi:hyperosmotically inducible protein
MTYFRSHRLLQALLLCSVASSTAFAQTAADNTKVNTRDRAAGAVTSDQQKETPADRDLTKRIRQSVVGDKTLSIYAHNVKIVTRGGQVTLKGPVNSAAEKQAIETKATAAAGAGRVTNDISIVAPKTSNK